MSTPPSGSVHADKTRRRHAEFFTELAEATQRDHLGPAQVPLRQRFRTEWDNIRAALQWTLDAGETELGLRLAGALTTIWLDRNFAVEGQQWFETLLERPEPVADDVRAKALGTAAMVAGVRSDFEHAMAWGRRRSDLYRALGSEEGIAWSLTTVALGPMEQGRPEEAGPMLEEAEDLHRKLGYTRRSPARSAPAGPAGGRGRRPRSRPAPAARVRRSLGRRGRSLQRSELAPRPR